MARPIMTLVDLMSARADSPGSRLRSRTSSAAMMAVTFLTLNFQYDLGRGDLKNRSDELVLTADIPDTLPATRRRVQPRRLIHLGGLAATAG